MEVEPQETPPSNFTLNVVENGQLEMGSLDTPTSSIHIAEE